MVLLLFAASFVCNMHKHQSFRNAPRDVCIDTQLGDTLCPQELLRWQTDVKIHSVVSFDPYHHNQKVSIPISYISCMKEEMVNTGKNSRYTSKALMQVSLHDKPNEIRKILRTLL